MGASSSVHRTGVFIGGAAPVTVASEKVGFRPSRVHLWNETTNSQAWWEETMADDSMQKVVGSTGVSSTVAANGITPTYSGFTLGVGDTDVVNDGDVIRFEAWG